MNMRCPNCGNTAAVLITKQTICLHLEDSTVSSAKEGDVRVSFGLDAPVRCPDCGCQGNLTDWVPHWDLVAVPHVV